MSWLSDATGVNWDFGIGGPDKDPVGAGFANENRKILAEADAYFAANANNVEQSLYADLYKEYMTMKQTRNYSGLNPLLAKFKSGVEKSSAIGAEGKKLQKSKTGLTTLLGGGDRYEQLLTKEAVGLQQEIGTKKNNTLLTENTIMATNAKAGI